jgi:hypothetical protein
MNDRNLADAHKSFRLRYVGQRFDGARLPLDVLSDLLAFRDLLVSYAKDEWRRHFPERQRLPRGFDKSISFDLISIESGSAMPKLDWNRETAQANLPGFTDELEHLVDNSYNDLTQLIDGAGNADFPQSLSSEHIRALNKLGSSLRDGERIEFLDSQGADGNVVFLDTYRRKNLITHVRETYQSRFEGIGRLLGTHLRTQVSGYIEVVTAEHGEIRILIDDDRIVNEFDGNINGDVQFALQIELDNNDKFRSIIDVFDVELIDEADLMHCKRRLAELRGFEAGWHNGSGAAVNTAALAVAERFLEKRPVLARAYHIYPTLAGGVLFEFENNGWDFSVEFGPGGTVEMYGVQIVGPEEMEPQTFDNLNSAFVDLFDTRIAR